MPAIPEPHPPTRESHSPAWRLLLLKQARAISKRGPNMGLRSLSGPPFSGPFDRPAASTLCDSSFVVPPVEFGETQSQLFI